jgi:RHS repeat-associated protein
VYSPFGAVLEGRSWSVGSGYRYGFQAQEEDAELWEGAVNYKYRVEDPRLGRFFSVDPLNIVFTWNSCYAFSENSVIAAQELEGLEASPVSEDDVEREFARLKELQTRPALTNKEILSLGTRIMNVPTPAPRNGWLIFECLDCLDNYGHMNQEENDRRKATNGQELYNNGNKIYKAIKPFSDAKLRDKIKTESDSDVAGDGGSGLVTEDPSGVNVEDAMAEQGCELPRPISLTEPMDLGNNRDMIEQVVKKSTAESNIVINVKEGVDREANVKLIEDALRAKGYKGKIGYSSNKKHEGIYSKE